MQLGALPVQSSAGMQTTLPAALANRQPLSLAGGVNALPQEEEGGLADLAGLLPDDELQAAHAVAVLQQFCRQPALSKFEPPPLHMYS
jgi:hypothetical protein